jgi:hypothetical protein
MGLIGVFSVAGGFLVALAAILPFSSDAARRKLVAVLAERLDSEVELQALRVRLFPRLRAEGDGLVIRHRGRRDVPPLISIAHFAAEGGLTSLLRKHISLVTVRGLDIQIPPDRNRNGGDEKSGDRKTADRTAGDEHAGDEKDGEVQPSGSGGSPAKTVVIDEMISSETKLTIIPREQRKPSRVWSIHRLRMRTLGVDQAMPFEATLTNAVPPGEIETSGSFGPWQAEVPGRTPLEGKFTFGRADLSVFKGISGILSAHGTFGGILERLDINGETDTPEFRVTAAGHPVPLHATYHAIVDGTNGNTLLDPVNGSFLNTSLVAKGGVVGVPGKEGRTVTLDITMTKARLEDVLKLAVKTPKSPMVGALQTKTHFVLPPGEQDVVKKLQLDGQFSIANTRFTDPDVQRKINGLSHRSQGKIQETSHVSSQFKGTFKLGGGSLHIPTVTFDVPGAVVQLIGTYDLVPETLNFSGTVQTDATISEMVGGVKGKALSVIDPIFAKKGGGGTNVPIKISGSRKNPSFGLDTGSLLKRRGEEAKGRS